MSETDGDAGQGRGSAESAFGTSALEACGRDKDADSFGKSAQQVLMSKLLLREFLFARPQATPTTGPGTTHWPPEAAGVRSDCRTVPSGQIQPSPRPGPGRKNTRKRRVGRRGPEPIDVEYYLDRLIEDELRTRQRAGDTEQEIGEALLSLKRKSAEQLAEEIERRFKRSISGKTISRNESRYKQWRRFREEAGTRKPGAVGRQPLRRTPPVTKGDIAEVDVISGQLSLRQGSGGPLRGRTRKDCRLDAVTNAWLREHGADPRECKAE